MYDLAVGPFGISQSERSECWQEVLEVLLDPWHEPRDIQIVYPKALNIGQCEKMTQGTGIQLFWIESVVATITVIVDMKLLDQGK